MNHKRALEILGMTEENCDDHQGIKNAYRERILQYHPDKNRSTEAAERFCEIREAYAYLQEDSVDESHCDEESYADVMKAFLSRVLEEEYAELAAPFLKKIVDNVFRRIIRYVEDNGANLLEYLRKINRPTLKAIYSLMLKYKRAFHLPDGLFEKVVEILQEDECIVLNPTLEDIMAEENIYKLKQGDHTYLVPLWHHEMTFDAGGRDLVVKCFPVLPENMELDEWNVLTVWLEYDVSDVWNRMVFITVGGQEFAFDGSRLRLTEDEQVIVLERCGVIYNNVREVFQSGNRQNIVLRIRLRMG
jgi:hypothetical protein